MKPQDFSLKEQIEYMAILRDHYLDCMEGTDLDEFKKWEHLMCCASDIHDAMKAELPEEKVAKLLKDNPPYSQEEKEKMPKDDLGFLNEVIDTVKK